MSTTPEWVKRRAEMLLGSAANTPAEMVRLLDDAGLLLPAASMVPAPYPITVRQTGLGVEISMLTLVSALITALAAESTEDPEGLADELAEIDAASGPERDELLQALVDRLGGATQSLGATAARDLAERLLAAVGPVLPAQQDRSAA
ncbi:hypothetical protein [Kitasatospora kifunensis]|uniref:Uncharacterized protein n=1 Tax=Kitasatospora kifunensis TaxID=58351 RepID=A0A7W7QYH5_KITKI|nr:hypothetical protein [Kitasatospora kifunensis]MBB4922142.1 hypothetical protein [Kitasatospora kifunensis]